MKRNIHKTLLVAVGLAMGSNSMTKINTHTVTLDPATSNFFIDDSRITSSVVEENNESVIQFLCAGNAQNGYSFSHCNFSELLPKEIKINKLTFDIDYYNTNGGRAILTVGDASVRGTTAEVLKLPIIQQEQSLPLEVTKTMHLLMERKKHWPIIQINGCILLLQLI